MANTPNIDLVKPAGSDHALVSVLNSNSDKIDTFAGSTNAAITNLNGNITKKANVIELQKTSIPVGQISSWDSVYSEIENGYAGIVIIHFQNGANITGLAYKNNASYGSILGTIDDDTNPFFYAVKNGTSALRRLAYST
jgi:hypothetical protein